jgi:multidrug resistance efflux pump
MEHLRQADITFTYEDHIIHVGAHVAIPKHRPTSLEKSASDLIASTVSYRAALEKVIVIHERELARRTELAELRRDLYERGVLSKVEFDKGQQAQTEARRNVEDTRRSIAEADRMLTEAREAAKGEKP